MRFRRYSLRAQLLAFGVVATVVPVFVLLSVVFATSSSEEIIDGPAGEVAVHETDGGVPPAVVITAFVLAGAAVVAVWWWAGRAVQPMKDIARVAGDIQAGSLDRRLGLTGEAQEVQALADSFDRMLDRLERASLTQQRLTEDASHELRTPLAALAVNAEVIRANPNPTPEEYEASLARSEALIDRLQLTIDELLSGARRRTETTRQVDNDVMRIVGRVVEQHRAVNPDVPIVVTGPEELRLGVDGPSIERALVNLVENAARFSPEGAAVEIDVRGGEEPTLSVTDDGPGIGPDRLDRVFDRYYRSDQGKGHGIGLALVKQVAEAHGSIAVESPVPGRAGGTRFVMAFGPSQLVS